MLSRRERVTNLIPGERNKAPALQLLARFRIPPVSMLLTASARSAFTGDATGFNIIGIIVLIRVTLDFVQEYRAGQAADVRAGRSCMAEWRDFGHHLPFVAE